MRSLGRKKIALLKKRHSTLDKRSMISPSLRRGLAVTGFIGAYGSTKMSHEDVAGRTKKKGSLAPTAEEESPKEEEGGDGDEGDDKV